MKDTLSKTQFCSKFREVRDNFTYEAMEALYDFYDEYDQACNTETEFDPIAICCDWDEYDDVEECREAFSSMDDDDYDDDDFLIMLESNTQVIRLGSGGVLVMVF